MIRLVHITDIHFGGGASRLFNKTGKIARCIISELPDEVEAIVLALNGDFTNKGQPKEFTVAAQFIQALFDDITKLNPTSLPITCLMTPGNHDCDLAGDQTLRSLAVSTLSTDRPAVSVEETVLKPLHNYFEFAQSLDQCLSASISRRSPYLSDFRLALRSHSLHFYLINSAWMSKRDEKANETTFPLSILPAPNAKTATASIVLMHHPLHWFRMPDTRTQFLDWITNSSDLLITGHEHTPREVTTSTGTVALAMCEGGALQESDESESSCFQVIDLDAPNKRGNSRRYVYDETNACYERVLETAITIGNPSNKVQSPLLNAKYQLWLDDPMLPPIHVANKQHLKLRDFFLYPDLNEYSNTVSPDERHMVRGTSVLELIVASNLTLLTGEDTCGKTALARQLVADLHSQGHIPVYLDSKDLKSLRTTDQYFKAIDKAIRRQYDSLTFESVMQLYEKELVVLVDDFHLLYQSGIRLSKHSELLESLANRIVILASDELVVCESHGHDGDFGCFAGYRKFQICEFGQLRFEALTKKWICLAEGAKIADPQSLDRKVKRVTLQIQNVLSADVIPHQPWILIVLLHQLDDSDAILVRNGSYGHMYQAIVTAALGRSKMSTLELNGKFSYLARLSHYIFSSGQDAISRRDARVFHEMHCEQVDIPLDFEATISDFVDAGILKSDENGIRILSRYAICFFLAWHLDRHLHEAWAQNDVESLCKKLYDPIAANTLLFLAHLTSSPFVAETIHKAASELFANNKMADFTEDVLELNKLGGTSTDITLPNTNPEQNRESFIENKEGDSVVDVSESSQELQMVAIVNPVERKGSYVEQMHEIQSAYKMIRILGQMVKNEADSAGSDWKVAIVDEVFRLSRRMLGSGFEELKDVDKWREVVTAKIQVKVGKQKKEKESWKVIHSKQAERKLMIKADREITSICWLACFTVVKIVAESTGAKALTGTFEKVVAKDPSIPNQLYQLDVLMEHGGDFPLKEALRLKNELLDNPFGIVLLKSLVAHYFYLYGAAYDVKQRICSRLEINLDRKKALNPENKRKNMRPPK